MDVQEWLQDHVLLQKTGEPLPPAKLDELRAIVGDDAGLAHTVLTVAALMANAEVVDWCLQHTAARPWIVKQTPLCASCCARGQSKFRAQCAEVFHGWRFKDGWKTAPLLAACAGGNLELLRYWIQTHAECASGVRNAALQDGAGSTALLWASCCGHDAVVEFLVREAGSCAITERATSGFSALLLACNRGHLSVARWLVTHAGSCPKSEPDNDGETALTAASWCGHLHVVQWLITAGLSCARTERNCDGNTALLIACKAGRLDVAQWLVAAAASCAKSERCSEGRTALLCACMEGHAHVAQWLLTFAGSSIDEKDNVLRTQQYNQLRAHWLRAAVALCHGDADVFSNRLEHETAPSVALRAALCDVRMRGCNDGQGHPLRYLSWYGGRVIAYL